RPNRRDHHPGNPQVAESERAGQPPQLDRDEREPCLGIDLRLEAAAADVEDVIAGDAEADQRLSDRQPRVDVAPGAGGGDGEGHALPPCWLMLTSTPRAPIDVMSAVLPKLTKGRAIPVMGRTPRTPPMLMRAWNEIQPVIPVANIFPNRSGARAATAHPATARAMKRPMTVIAPIKPVSSPMMAKMKSVWALGRENHRARLAPRPTPKIPPSPKAE